MMKEEEKAKTGEGESLPPPVVYDEFGDILISYAPDMGLPLLPYLDPAKSIFISGVPPGIPFPRRFCAMDRYLGMIDSGRIFGNAAGQAKFPVIRDKMTQGACGVVFLESKEKEETYALFVQVKKRAYVMNPAGFEAIEDNGCPVLNAVRKVKDETGILLDIEKHQSLASWTFDHKFGGIPLTGKTTALFFQSVLPSDWQTTKTEPVRIIRVSTHKDIESIVLVNVKNLADSDLKTPTPISPHHLNLALHAAIHKTKNANPDALQKGFKPAPYLKTFAFE